MSSKNYHNNNKSSSYANMCFKSINFEGQGKSINRQTQNRKFHQIVYFLTHFSHLNTDRSLCRSSRSTHAAAIYIRLFPPLPRPHSKLALNLNFFFAFGQFIRTKQFHWKFHYIIFENALKSHDSQFCIMLLVFFIYLFGGISLCIHSLFVFELWRSSLKSR